jgi:hypothetical protein
MNRVILTLRLVGGAGFLLTQLLVLLTAESFFRPWDASFVDAVSLWFLGVFTAAMTLNVAVRPIFRIAERVVAALCWAMVVLGLAAFLLIRWAES